MSARIAVGVLWCLAFPLLTIGFFNGAVWVVVLGVVSLLAGAAIGRSWAAALPFGLLAAAALTAYLGGAHASSNDEDGGSLVWWLLLAPAVFAAALLLAGVRLRSRLARQRRERASRRRSG